MQVPSSSWAEKHFDNVVTIIIVVVIIIIIILLLLSLFLLLLLLLFDCHAGEAVSHGGQETRLDTASHNQHHRGGILESKVGLQQHRLIAASSSFTITILCATGPQKVARFAEGAAFDAMGCIKLLICVMRHFNLFTGNASQADTTNQQ